ncbi:MAG: DUF4446 family protein [Selenomonadaceae bacterium]
MSKETLALFEASAPYIMIALGALCLILLILVIVLFSKVSTLRARYDNMMHGEETGTSFEQMMLDHIKKTEQVSQENAHLKEENERISKLLDMAITRIGIVRFSAFADTGGDLSYAMAMLDQHNDGVVVSSIFGRDGSRSYAKPIKNGKSEYKLSTEEESALKEAEHHS